MPSPHQISQQEIIDELLEELANIPLEDHSLKILWAIDFIDKFARRKGLRGV